MIKWCVCDRMIRKQERCTHQHSHIDLASTYPSDVALVGHMDGSIRHQDALSEYYNVDALWGFAIGATHDIRERVVCC